MHITDTMYNKKWGVFNHYLFNIQNNPNFLNNQGAGETDWNSCTADLDVEKIAKTLHEIGAGYYFITVMQGRKYMIADNKAYRSVLEDTFEEDALSKRDLIEELYQALCKYDIDLYLYFTGDGPYKDEEYGQKFGFTEPRIDVQMDFINKWASVLEEYAVRYGDKVKGWWIDGCYDARHGFNYSQEKLAPYYEACKKGNPNALVAMNNGVYSPLYRWYEKDDYTTGEQVSLDVFPESRFTDGAQSHILLPIGNSDMGIGASWGSGGLFYTKEQLADYVTKVNSLGGVVTFDCKLNRDGSFAPEQIEALKYVGECVKKANLQLLRKYYDGF